MVGTSLFLKVFLFFIPHFSSESCSSMFSETPTLCNLKMSPENSNTFRENPIFPCKDIAKAILLQRAWLNGYGSTPEHIAKVLEDIIAATSTGGGGGDSTIEQNLINVILAKLSSDDMSVDDVMKALQFDKALDMSGASVASIRELMGRFVVAGGGKKGGLNQNDLSQAIQVCFYAILFIACNIIIHFNKHICLKTASGRIT
jgi:hypothetical protein